MSSVAMKVVGYFFDEGKIKRLKFDEYLAQFKPRDFKYKKIDFSKSAEEQEHFDLIIHKYNDLLTTPEEDSPVELQRARKLLTSGMPVIDPIANVKVLFNRFDQFSLLKRRIEEDPELADKVFVPSFCILEDADPEVSMNRMLKADVRFPIVCKPIVAHGKGAHEMCLVFHKGGLKDVPPPMVAQTFVNHNAVLHKVFVVGSAIQATRRPSLKNFSEGEEETLFFHSLGISKEGSGSELNQLDEEDRMNERLQPDPKVLHAIGTLIRDALRLDLIGIDVIIDLASRKYGVIDVNSFPGYESMTNFYDHFEQLVRDKLHLGSASNSR